MFAAPSDFDGNEDPGPAVAETIPLFQNIIDSIVASEKSEEREAHAKSLGEVVENFWRLKTRSAHEVESQSFETVLLDLLTSGNERKCLAAIAAQLALLKWTTQEAHKDRVGRVGIALHNIETVVLTRGGGSIEIAEAVAELIERFSWENGRAVERVIVRYLWKARYALINQLPAADNDEGTGLVARAFHCLLISSLAHRPQFRKLHDDSLRELVPALAELMANPTVRDFAVPGVTAVLSAIPASWRAVVWGTVDNYFCDTLDHPLEVDTPHVEGALCLVASILGNPSLKTYLLQEIAGERYRILGFRMLGFREVEDIGVQRAIGDVFSRMAEIYPEKFCSSEYVSPCMTPSFMSVAFDYLDHRASDSDQLLSRSTRQDALLSLGRIVEAVSANRMCGRFGPFLKRAITLSKRLLEEAREAKENALTVNGGEGSTTNRDVSSLQQTAILDFVTCVCKATRPEDPNFNQESFALLVGIAKVEVSQSLMNALEAHGLVAKSQVGRIQNIVLAKAAEVLAEAMSFSTLEASPATGLVGDGTRSGTGAPSCRAVEGLFIARTEKNSEPGYVSALTGIRRPLSGVQSEYMHDVAFDFELHMDPALRPDPTGPALVVEVTPTPRIVLTTLANTSFNTLPAPQLAFYANKYVVPYLESPNIVERRMALKAITNLLKSAAVQNQSNWLQETAFFVLSQLVAVAAVDPSRRVRLTALNEINAVCFERYLAQAELLPVLSLCLHDEDFGVRAQAVKLMCRLYDHDAGEVELILSQFVVHVLGLLRCHSSTFAGLRAQSSRLLQLLVVFAPKFIKKFGACSVEVLIGCLKHEVRVIAKVDPNATLPVIEAIGGMANIFEVRLLPFANDVVPLLVRCVLDVDAPDESIELVSMEALAAVVQSTTIPDEPYETDARLKPKRLAKPYEADARLLPKLIANLREGSGGRIGKAKLREGSEARIGKATLVLLGAVGVYDPDNDDVKYVTLPSGQTLSFAVNDSGLPRVGTFVTQDAVFEGLGGAGSLGGPALAVGGDETASASIPGQHSPSATVESVPASSRAAASFDLGAPPLISNAATGVDLDWVYWALNLETPVWKQPQLSTPCLVARLEHPFTDSELYFPSVVLDFLHGLLGQSKHTNLHLVAVDCTVLLVHVLKKEGERSYFLPEIVPRLLWVLQPVDRESRLPTSDNLRRLFHALSCLASGVGEDFQKYLPDTINLCCRYLTDSEASYRELALPPITELLVVLASSIGPAFRPYAIYMLAPLVSALVSDTSVGYAASANVIWTFEKFGKMLAQYSGIVLSALVVVFENSRAPRSVRASAIYAVGRLVPVFEFVPEQLSSILHPLVRVLGTAGGENSCLGRAAAVAIREVAACSPEGFKYFAPVVAKAILTRPCSRDSPEFSGLEAALLRSSGEIAANILDRSRLSEDGIRALLAQLDAKSADLVVMSQHEIVFSNDPSLIVSRHGPQANPEDLMAVFDIYDGMSEEGWTEWIDSLVIALVSHAEAPAMRAVADIGEQFPHLLRGLFNAAFLSCWSALQNDNEPYQNKVLLSFREALGSPICPLPVKQLLLDLFEFMDHDERPMPFDNDRLVHAAMDVGATAKALRYKENQYLSSTTEAETLKVIDHNRGLIEIYSELGHAVSAVGTLEAFEAICDDEEAARQLRDRYNEILKLLPDAKRYYENALGALPDGIDLSTANFDSQNVGEFLYSRQLAGLGQNAPVDGVPQPGIGVLNIPDTAEERDRDVKWFLSLALLRVLDGLGEWHDMNERADRLWGELDGNAVARSCLAVGGAAASVAFDLEKWDSFEERVESIGEEKPWEKHFYKSLVCVNAVARDRPYMLDEARSHIDQSRGVLSVLDEAQGNIDEARSVLNAKLMTSAAEGYPRAYADFLDAQHLVEIEEMTAVMREGRSEDGRWSVMGMERNKALWSSRLETVKPDQRTWYRLLMIRSLLLDPSDNKEHWLKFATKCRKDVKLPMATEALRKLVRGVFSDRKRVVDDEQERLVRQLLDPSILVSDWSVDSLCAIPDRAVQFACVKHLWASHDENCPVAFSAEKAAFAALKACMSDSRQRLPGELLPPVAPEPNTRQVCPRDPEGEDGLYAEIFLKLAKWCVHVNSSSLVDGNATGGSSSAENAVVADGRSSSAGDGGNASAGSSSVEDGGNAAGGTSPAGEGGTESESAKEAIRYVQKATRWRPTWYKGWHFWATLNLREAKKELPDESGMDRLRFDELKAPDLTGEAVSRLSRAVEGFFRAINYGGKTCLEDVLTLLSLWFRYGSDDNLRVLFEGRFEQSDPNKWLAVIPQIIARLFTRDNAVRDGIVKLLIHVGVAHPQAIVFPLIVAVSPLQGSSQIQENRRQSAQRVLDEIENKHPVVVADAKLVAAELHRVAILELELWSDCIEEASRMYYTNNDFAGMLTALRPLHKMLKMKPETDFEENFRRDYGEELGKADQFGRDYLAARTRLEESGLPADEDEAAEMQSFIDRACDCYLAVIRSIQRFRSRMHSLDLKGVSRKLFKQKNMALALPGQYAPKSGEIVTVMSFGARLEVMQSKQRPRKLQILGSDGKQYGFLLKGHDDLRQDERVMQVFHLFNEHLARSEERAVRHGAQLKLYAITVLSSKAGLIEWVPHCDTMHSLVKTFRENHQVLPNVEQRLMLTVAPDPEKLSLLQRADVFQFMLDNTAGRDIARMLWLKSRNSEMWLDRRTNFARTLATTSIAGYILGVGDRHPSNIMIERSTGKIMHIDFGDCFEVATRRDKYPEKVPFRLTRMLVQALEPCGVRGNFRRMAIAMMKVLRGESTKDAVLAMMEAFVYDPLIRQNLFDEAELKTAAAAEAEADPAAPADGAGGPASVQGPLAVPQHGIVAHVVGGAEAEAEAQPMQPAAPRSATAVNRSYAEADWFRKMADERAIDAYSRIINKLSGRDFEETSGQALGADEQVDRLVQQARSIENLCTSFVGWCAPW